MGDCKMMAAEASLKKMFSDKYFSICSLDAIVESLGLSPPSQLYAQLRTLHCVNYGDMPPELLVMLPEKIAEVLRSPSFDASRLNIVSDGSVLRLVKT